MVNLVIGRIRTERLEILLILNGPYSLCTWLRCRKTHNATYPTMVRYIEQHERDLPSASWLRNQ